MLKMANFDDDPTCVLKDINVYQGCIWSGTLEASFSIQTLRSLWFLSEFLLCEILRGSKRLLILNPLFDYLCTLDFSTHSSKFSSFVSPFLDMFCLKFVQVSHSLILEMTIHLDIEDGTNHDNNNFHCNANLECVYIKEIMNIQLILTLIQDTLEFLSWPSFMNNNPKMAFIFPKYFILAVLQPIPKLYL